MFPKHLPFFLFPCSLCSQCSGSQPPCQLLHPDAALIHISLSFFFFTASFRPPTLTLLHALLIRFIFLPFPLIQSQAPQAKCLKLSALSPTSLSGSFPVSLSSPSPQFHIPPSSHSSCLDSPCLSIFSSHPIQTPGTLCVILSWFALLSWLWWNCISC